MNSEDMKTLTVAGARRLVKDGSFNFKGLTCISDKVAEVLGTGKGTLDLSGALRGFVWVVLGRGGALCAIRAGSEWALRGFAKPLCEGA